MKIREFLEMTPGRQLWQLRGEKAVGAFREVLAGSLVSLASVPCSSVVFNNTTGGNIWIYRGTDTGSVKITIPNNSGMEFDVVDNANELSVATESGDDQLVQYQCVGEDV